MKVQTQPNLNQWRFAKTLAAAVLAVSTLVPTAFGASQTWTNAPVTGDWTNILNWVGKAVPGALNPAANALSGDTATFNTPLAGGLGGTLIPVNNDTNRNVKFILFDTTNCGAYVVGNIDSNILQVSSTTYPGGNVTVGAGVTNPQVINAPLFTRLASSSSGGFSFINNSSNLNATLTIANVTNSSAGSRPMTFFLDGSNAGSNVLAHIGDNNGANGAILVTKQGAGTWVLTGANDLPQKTSTPTVGSGVAAVSVNAGKLIVRDPGSLGAITAANLVVSNTGILQIDGVTLNNAGISLKNGGTIKMNGSGTVNGVTVGNQSALSATVATTSASDVLTVGNAVNKLTGGAADSVLHFAGPGTVLLAFDANYIGKVAIDSGTNQLGAGTTVALGTGASTTIAAGAVLDVTPLGAVTYTLSTAALGGSGTGTAVGTTAAAITADAGAIIDLAAGAKAISLTITPTAFTGDTTHPALYLAQGTLALGGNAFSINNASGTALGAGTYRLITQASGSITDGGGYSVVGVTGSGLVSGNVASIQVSGGNVNLVVSAYVPKNLVWTGGALNANWDIATDANWLNGGSPIVFNNSDNVTFNSVGATNPTVTLVSTLAPSSVTVDTAANNYAFNGSGSIAGSAALVKKSSGTLVLGTVNTYGGGTIVSNGVLQIAANNAVSATGAGDVTISSAGKLDLNGFNNAINGLNGSGSVDVTSGGNSTLAVGNNNNSGTFAGSLLNTSGSLSLTKNGTGVQILSGSNNYSGATTINVGSLRVTDRNALGSGASAITVNSGTLDVSTNVVIASLAGNGTVANNSTTSTNTITLQTGSAFGGSIVDGTGGGGLAVLVSSGTLSLNAANSYSGGTLVAGGAGLVIGAVGSAGAGGIIASNLARVGFANGGNPAAFAGNNLTTVDNASVLVTGGGNQANNLAFQFYGGATATNIFSQACSVGGVSSFANFFGTAIISNTASLRFFNALGGGDGTTFDFQGGGVFSRDNSTIRLGALQGGSATTGIYGPSVSFPATFIIGGKGLSTVFSGVISGSNNIVKTGAGSLTFNGAAYTVNTDNATYTNTLYTGGTITYLNNTTISNGTLSIVVPNNLNNSPTITLAGAGAVLDVSKMGYITNLLSVDDNTTPTNSLLVTNGIFELLATTPSGTPQTLAGFGTINGTLLADTGATIAPGLPVGTLTVTNGVTLNGVNFNVEVNRTNAQTSDQLAAAGATSLTVNGGTLTLTNLGPDLITGDVFHVFNKASVGNFAVTNLPASNALNTVAYVWTNKLAMDGTLVVLQGAAPVNTAPTNLVASVSGNVLTLTWPADHTGWKLQIQTNSLNTGLNTNWVTLPGSDLVNATNLTINPANGTVFYRMVYP